MGFIKASPIGDDPTPDGKGGIRGTVLCEFEYTEPLAIKLKAADKSEWDQKLSSIGPIAEEKAARRDARLAVREAGVMEPFGESDPRVATVNRLYAAWRNSDMSAALSEFDACDSWASSNAWTYSDIGAALEPFGLDSGDWLAMQERYSHLKNSRAAIEGYGSALALDAVG